MDTTISDLATFIAALARGDGLSKAGRAEMVKPSLHIGTAHQFPNFAADRPKAEQRPDLAAGLGVIVFEGPQGRGFYKGGHDAQRSGRLESSQKKTLSVTPRHLVPATAFPVATTQPRTKNETVAYFFKGEGSDCWCILHLVFRIDFPPRFGGGVVFALSVSRGGT
jgi:hypothetical protein